MKFIPVLLDWYQVNKRNFPWRLTQDFYKIWICEIIFQQTRIAQGREYYDRFINKFPNIKSLAEADEQEVLTLWQGLGYYSRARNVHFSAQYIWNESNGNIPKTFLEIKKLKGVGDYTAAAIASICFDEKVPAIDGNALRVYARLFNDFSDIALPITAKNYFEQVKPMMQSIPAGNFNQAIMELGALICLPKNPKCDLCPVMPHCQSFKNKTTDILPIKNNKLKVKERFLAYFFITDGKHFFIQKRTQNGIWQNMYEFITEDFQLQKPISIQVFNHKLTHLALKIQIKDYQLSAKAFQELKNKHTLQSLSFKEMAEFPFPIIFKKYVLNYIESV